MKKLSVGLLVLFGISLFSYLIWGHGRQENYNEENGDQGNGDQEGKKTLTVNVTDGGWVWIYIDGFQQSWNEGTYELDEGSDIHISAEPYPGYELLPIEPSGDFNLDEDTTVNITFVEQVFQDF